MAAASQDQTALPARSILVYVGLDLMGDGIMKLPFVRALRAAYPDASITWLAGKGATVYGSALRPLTDGLIDEVIENADIGKRWPELLRRPLPGRAFDLILDTQRRLQTSLILRRIRHRWFLSSAADWRLSDRQGPAQKPPRMLDQILQLVAVAKHGDASRAATLPLADLPPLPDAVTAGAEALLPPGPAYVALAPGAGGRHKCWPLERFIALGQALAADGAVPVMILGPQESEWRTEIAKACPRALFPFTDAPEDLKATGPLLTMAVARRVQAAVANDAGAGHILAAGDAPLLSLFGPTKPEKFAPAARIGRVLQAQDFGGDSMDAIPLNAVREALESLRASRI